jgi:hypothetical protein
MMNLLTREDLKRLSAIDDDACVSIYMPTVTSGKETRQNPTRFKNLLRDAERRLSEMEMRAAEITEFLSPAYSVLENMDLWQHQSRGFAAFLYSGGFEYYQLPIEFEELLMVTGRFHLKPLLPLFSGDGRYFVLSVSMRENHLYLASRHTMSEIRLPNAPANIDEALQYDQPERQLNYHATESGSARVAYHGQEREDRYEKKHMVRYLRRLDDAVHRRLATEHAPLLVAGLDHIAPLYQTVSTYPYTYHTTVSENPDGMSLDDLHSKSWETVREEFTSALQEALSRYNDLSSSDTTTDNVRKIVPASYNSRIDTLFIPSDAHVWGCYRPGESDVEIHEDRRNDDEDLLDLAAVQALLHGGTVYAVSRSDIPSGAPTAAILRY